MASSNAASSFSVVTLLSLILACLAFQTTAQGNQTSTLVVDAGSGRPMPKYFFGVFFEEINHAGAGGLWAELVSNRGFEAGGIFLPSNIYPWSIIGDESSIMVSTDPTSCFPRNKIALRMEVLCKQCPAGGVGISNPGYWGMNIEQGKRYKVVFYVRSQGPINLKVSLTGLDDGKELASAQMKGDPRKWTRMETTLVAKASNFYSSLQLTTTTKGLIWFDQVSAMPMDTYMGHGFRKDLYQMVADLKPSFIRFPGGCFVEGDYLRNAFRWKDSIGAWEQRPGHYNDVWAYWTDDGFGYLEFLQLAEDLGSAPVWVFNNGISHHDEVNTSVIAPFVQEALDGIEFARGAPTSKWGRVRASLGRRKPFDLRIVAVGNEDCGKFNYLGNYLKFYHAIKQAYPDMQIISNCDASEKPLDHPANLYDFHIYTNAKDLFSKKNMFDKAPRGGAKAFVSEYAVWKEDALDGTLLAALGEAGFLVGLERNSDAVEMFSYAPLFTNVNDKKWTPDAIYFDSHQSYATPSYYLQQLFAESSGATFLNSTLQTSSPNLAASAITWTDSKTRKSYLRIKAVNLENNPMNLKISINGWGPNLKASNESSMTVLTSPNVMDQNSFKEPKKVVPIRTPLENVGKDMSVTLSPHSVTWFDLPK